MEIACSEDLRCVENPWTLQFNIMNWYECKLQVYDQPFIWHESPRSNTYYSRAYKHKPFISPIPVSMFACYSMLHHHLKSLKPPSSAQSKDGCLISMKPIVPLLWWNHGLRATFIPRNLNWNHHPKKSKFSMKPNLPSGNQRSRAGNPHLIWWCFSFLTPPFSSAISQLAASS